MSNLMTSDGDVRMARNRGWVALALAGTMALGLLSRRYPMPGILAEYTGDALYAVAVFMALALLFAGARSRSLAVSALVLSALVECAQLIKFPWLNDLRSTSVGRAVLGSGFKWSDMVAYSIGAMVAAVVDFGLRQRRVCSA
jgi:hypothetical protein